MKLGAKKNQVVRHFPWANLSDKRKARWSVKPLDGKNDALSFVILQLARISRPISNCPCSGVIKINYQSTQYTSQQVSTLVKQLNAYF